MLEPEGKKTGLAHLFAATSYSWHGFWRVLKEAAFRHEILYFLVGLIAFWLVDATVGEYLLLTLIFLIMFGFEALNTAIEELVDRVSPERSEMGKHAKDLGSFAVFCMLLAAAIYIAYVVFL
jgi:diacylglycerol kinase (ATP)